MEEKPKAISLLTHYPPTSSYGWSQLPCELQCEILGYVLQNPAGCVKEYEYWRWFNLELENLCTLNKEFAAVALHVGYTINTFSFNMPTWGQHAKSRCSMRYCTGKEVAMNACSSPRPALWPSVPICNRLRKLEIQMWSDNMLDCSSLEALFQCGKFNHPGPKYNIASLLVPKRTLALENDNHLHWSEWQNGLQHLKFLRIVIKESYDSGYRGAAAFSFHSLKSLDQFEELTKETEIKLRATKVQVVIEASSLRTDSDIQEEDLDVPMEILSEQFAERLQSIFGGMIKSPEHK